MKPRSEMIRMMSKMLEEEVCVLSWGIKDIKLKENKISFRVSGLKYRGQVVITYNNDKYNITLHDKVIDGNLDNIISILDKEIEQTEHYTSDLQNLIMSSIDSTIV